MTCISDFLSAAMSLIGVRTGWGNHGPLVGCVLIALTLGVLAFNVEQKHANGRDREKEAQDASGRTALSYEQNHVQYEDYTARLAVLEERSKLIASFIPDVRLRKHARLLHPALRRSVPIQELHLKVSARAVVKRASLRPIL